MCAHVDRHEVERLGLKPSPCAFTTALTGISEKPAINEKIFPTQNHEGKMPQSSEAVKLEIVGPKCFKLRGLITLSRLT